MARLFLSTQNNAPAKGKGELVALANGGVQLNALDQNIVLNTTNSTANLVIEPNTGGGNNGEVICFYGFQNLSDERLKTNVQPLSTTEAQELFDKVEARSYDRVDGAPKQVGLRGAGGGRVGPAGQELLQAEDFRRPGIDDAGLPADDGGAVADLQEPAAEGREAGKEEARALLKWRTRRPAGAAGPGLQRAGSAQALPNSSAGVPAPAGPDERTDGGGPARRRGPAGAGAQAKEGPNDRLQADLVDFSQNTQGQNKYGLVVQDVFTRRLPRRPCPTSGRKR